MRNIGVAELIIMLALCFPLFCLWKFYQLVSKIKDEVAGIRRAIESKAAS